MMMTDHHEMATKRDIAFIDIETTGLEPDYHDIIEVATIRLDPYNDKVLTEMTAKIHPENPQRIDLKAIEINNYSPCRWKDARSLGDVLEQLTEILHGCIIAGHNVPFDWSFILSAYRRLEIVQPEVDFHLIDTASFAWPLVIAGVIEKPTLRALCDLLGVSNDYAHSALSDARRAMEVYRRLADLLRPELVGMWCRLQTDDRVIVEQMVARLHTGQNCCAACA